MHVYAIKIMGVRLLGMTWWFECAIRSGHEHLQSCNKSIARCDVFAMVYKYINKRKGISITLA